MLLQLQSLFLGVFTLFYSIIHTHLMSYIVILVMCLFLLKKTWNSIQNKKKKNKGLLKKGISFSLLTFIFLFTIWFVFFHFHTFRLLA